MNMTPPDAKPVAAVEKEAGLPKEQEENPESQDFDNETDIEAESPGFLQRIKQHLPFRKNGTLRRDLEVVLEQDDSDLTFSPEERAMLKNILALREVRADDIMVPRADIDGIDVMISLGELIFRFEEARHSRMPVYRETLDDPIGMVHVKDLMGYIMGRAEENPHGEMNLLHNDVVDYDLSNVDLTESLETAEIIRPLLFIPPSMSASDIFAKMQTTRTQMALVIDEYGGTDGLISMEDVVEVIVGDIEDEHDDDDEGPQIVKETANSWSADARVSLDDICQALDISLDRQGEEEADTIGGLLFTELGRVPVRGEVVNVLDDFDFEILEADPRRIRRVRIMKDKGPFKRRRRRAEGEVAEAEAPEKPFSVVKEQ